MQDRSLKQSVRWLGLELHVIRSMLHHTKCSPHKTQVTMSSHQEHLSN